MLLHVKERFRGPEMCVIAENTTHEAVGVTKTTSNEVGTMTHGVISSFRNPETEKSLNITSGVIGSWSFDAVGGFQGLLHLADDRKATKTGNGVGGSSTPDSLGNFQRTSLTQKSPVASSRSAPELVSAYHNKESCMRSVSPLVPLSSSFSVVGLFRRGNNSGQRKMETREKNMPVALQLEGPLRRENYVYARAARSTKLVMKCTWQTRALFEKSKELLVSIFLILWLQQGRKKMA